MPRGATTQEERKREDISATLQAREVRTSCKHRQAERNSPALCISKMRCNAQLWRKALIPHRMELSVVKMYAIRG